MECTTDRSRKGTVHGNFISNLEKHKDKIAFKITGQWSEDIGDKQLFPE